MKNQTRREKKKMNGMEINCPRCGETIYHFHLDFSPQRIKQLSRLWRNLSKDSLDRIELRRANFNHGIRIRTADSHSSREESIVLAPPQLARSFAVA